ncbi:MAG TPA: NHL repeat-containing protein, partial [Desulfobaccales bacterium]
MAYDASYGLVVLFGGGGANISSFLNDTWMWDGNNWTQESQASSPPGREDATMAYDASYGQVVLFSGYDGSNFLSDTWTLQIGSFNFSSANVCLSGATPAPCTQQATFNYAVSSGTTIGSVNIFTQGAPNLDFIATPADSSTTLCTATTYDSDTVCTVDVTFAPLRPGQRLGAVVLTDGSGNPLATTYLSGNGVGPLVNFATVNAGAYTPSALTTLGTGFSYPAGVAVDASGNVFVADTSHGAVKEIVAAGGYTTVNTLSSGFNNPRGVAVDGSGNVFVADWSSSGVKEMVAVNGSIPASSPTILALGSGFDLPTGVAVDGSGDVFVADRGSNKVKEMVAVNG